MDEGYYDEATINGDVTGRQAIAVQNTSVIMHSLSRGTFTAYVL